MSNQGGCPFRSHMPRASGPISRPVPRPVTSVSSFGAARGLLLPTLRRRSRAPRRSALRVLANAQKAAVQAAGCSPAVQRGDRRQAVIRPGRPVAPRCGWRTPMVLPKIYRICIFAYTARAHRTRSRPPPSRKGPCLRRPALVGCSSGRSVAGVLRLEAYGQAFPASCPHPVLPFSMPGWFNRPAQVDRILRLVPRQRIGRSPPLLFLWFDSADRWDSSLSIEPRALLVCRS